ERVDQETGDTACPSSDWNDPVVGEGSEPRDEVACPVEPAGEEQGAGPDRQPGARPGPARTADGDGGAHVGLRPASRSMTSSRRISPISAPLSSSAPDGSALPTIAARDLPAPAAARNSA